jgi:prephenate dehydratase
VLEPFTAHDINLTGLHSRPARWGHGDHCFVIDMQGHVGDKPVAGCLRALARTLPEVRFLGSYPAPARFARSCRDPRRAPADAAARRRDLTPA